MTYNNNNNNKVFFFLYPITVYRSIATHEHAAVRHKCIRLRSGSSFP